MCDASAHINRRAAILEAGGQVSRFWKIRKMAMGLDRPGESCGQ